MRIVGFKTYCHLSVTQSLPSQQKALGEDDACRASRFAVQYVEPLTSSTLYDTDIETPWGIMEPMAIIAVTVFAAGIVQGLTGFGSGLVMMSVMPALIGIRSAVPFAMIFSFVLSISVMIRLRSHFKWKPVQPLVIGALPAIPVGIFLLSSINPVWITGALGLLLVSFASFSLMKKADAIEPQATPHAIWGYVAGACSGLLGGAFNTGGPPVVLYASLCPWKKEATVATLQAFFTISGAIGLLGLAIAGLFTQELLLWNLIDLPVLLAGAWVGLKLNERVDQETFRRLLFITLGVMGSVYLIRVF
jgi:uncharacterized membrane protein YfcA